jgi:regulatory protein
MDRPEPEGGSSSPSAEPAGPLQVTELIYSASDAERVTVRLSDGSSFHCPVEVVSAAALSAGTPLDPDRLAAVQQQAEGVFARQSALRLLARAPQTRRGLVRKLQARGFGAAAVRAAVSRMAELGYLDDRAFAENWTRARLSSRAEGWKAVYRGLLARGVPRQLAAEAASAACPEDVELELARRVAAGREPRRAAARLSARGFRSATIARVIRELRDRGGNRGDRRSPG